MGKRLIAHLQVPVDDVITVQGFEALDHILADVGDLRLRQRFVQVHLLVRRLGKNDSVTVTRKCLLHEEIFDREFLGAHGKSI